MCWIKEKKNNNNFRCESKKRGKNWNEEKKCIGAWMYFLEVFIPFLFLSFFFLLPILFSFRILATVRPLAIQSLIIQQCHVAEKLNLKTSRFDGSPVSNRSIYCSVSIYLSIFLYEVDSAKYKCRVSSVVRSIHIHVFTLDVGVYVWCHDVTWTANATSICDHKS